MHQRGDLTRDSQLIYLTQWLGEFSEVEKDDFLQQMLDVYAPGQLAIGQRLAPLKGEDKLPTLFDCRIDLFKRWFESWEQADREEFLNRLKEADAAFIERFEKSKEMPNEDKIIEEFWLRLDNGASQVRTEQEAPVFHVRQNGTSTVQENGTSNAVQNGSVKVEENGLAHPEENGTANAGENEQENVNGITGAAEVVCENGSENDCENGTSYNGRENGSVPSSIPNRLLLTASIPSVEITSPTSEYNDDEAVDENIASLSLQDSPKTENSEDQNLELVEATAGGEQ